MDRFFFTLDVLFEDCVNALRTVLRVLTHTVTVPSCAVGIIRKSFFFSTGKIHVNDLPSLTKNTVYKHKDIIPLSLNLFFSSVFFSFAFPPIGVPICTQ